MDSQQDHMYGSRERQLQPSTDQHQRFSWQVPPNTPPEEVTAQSQPQPSRQINTNVNQVGRAFSYAQTPIEHRTPHHYTSSPSDPPLPQSPPTPIDPRPQSVFNPQSPPIQSQPQQSTYASHPHEKLPLSPVSPLASAHPLHSSTPSLPAQPPLPLAQGNHARQLNSLTRINTKVGQYNRPPMPATPHLNNAQASPLPQKPPLTPASQGAMKKDPSGYLAPMSSKSDKSGPLDPYSPYGFVATPNRAVFSPDAATGPNGLEFAAHQPGQITHPNMDLSPKGTLHEWKHSLCECNADMATCMTGLFCPCVLYGKTSYRLRQRAEKKDPTDMLGYSTTNGHCMLMGVSCGLWWLFPMIQRTRLRHLYKLSGSFGGDLVKACCCCCCVTIQNEREVRDKEERSRRWAGPASTDVYKAPPQMSYAPQR